MTSLRTLALTVAVGFSLAAPGCDGTTGNGGSETHWLSPCAADRDCQAGARCVCGACTRPCSATSDCVPLGPSALCYAASAASPTCEHPGAPRVCMVPCGSAADCSTFAGASRCLEGLCRAGSPGGNSGPGSGAVGGGDLGAAGFAAAGGTTAGGDRGAAGFAAAGGNFGAGGLANAGGAPRQFCPEDAGTPLDAGVDCPDGGSTMSDPANCGACDNECAAGAIVLWYGPGGLNGRTDAKVYGTRLYWTTGNELWGAPVAGGGASLLVASQPFDMSHFAIDATSAYYTNWGDGTVAKVPLGGGSPTVLVEGQDTPSVITVDATSVYWGNSDTGAVMKAPIGGGTATLLATGPVGIRSITVDASSVYWTSTPIGAESTVSKVPLGGGSVTVLARGGLGIYRGIAVDATHVYWVTNDSILSVPQGGGTPTTLVSGQALPQGLAVDETGIYWTSGNDGTVNKANLDGSGVTTLIGSQGGPAPIAVDDSSVYWINEATGTVMSLGSKTRFGAVSCEQGRCVCPGDTVACFGICGIDTNSDDRNCGGCGILCGPGTTCHCGSCF